MEKRTLYHLDIRRPRTARFYFHRLVPQVTCALIAKKGDSSVNLHPVSPHDATAEQSFFPVRR